MKVVIIGGVAGGASAAVRIRRLDERAEIVMFERGEHISFANCGLPYYIGGAIQEEDDLLLQTPQSFRQRFRVDVRTESEVIKINANEKTVDVRHQGRVYQERYDKLVIATGAEPIVPNIQGADCDNVFVLRDVPDARRILNAARGAKTAVVVGGGYAGIEVAENLSIAGLTVTIVEAAGQILAPFDVETARLIQRRLQRNGIETVLNRAVKSIRQEGGHLVLALEDSTIIAELVVMAVGVRPESGLAVAAGIQCNERGAIQTDETMRTSNPDIYAVGDAVEVRHFVSGKQTYIPLAGPANKQGRIVANNICGIRDVYGNTQGSSILKVFDMTAAATGLNEKMVKALGFHYEKSYTYSPGHATYYPGAEEFLIKLIFDRVDGQVLGAQVIGGEGADKRCDVLASAIRAHMNVRDLTRLELCYAPPYSSAKDPVNMAGYVAENILDGIVKVFHWHDLDRVRADENAFLLDTRTPHEYARGHIDGFVNIPLDDLRERLGEIDAKKTIYVHCRSGQRSYLACRILMQNGFDCCHLSGGYHLYESL